MAPPVGRFLPETWRASASFGGAVRYDPAGMLRALGFFPFACLEQSASQLLAFAAMPGAGDPARLGQAVAAVRWSSRAAGRLGDRGRLAAGEVPGMPWLGT